MGFDHLPQAASRTAGGVGQQVVFVGNYAWSPTRDGARLLLTTIWPQVVKELPHARLSLVGQGMDNEVRRWAASACNVAILGPVESVVPFLNGADVFVCPIRLGTGVKVKLGEALRCACPIVATPEALQGLPAETTKAVAIAEGPAQMAQEIIQLLRDPIRRSNLSRMAAEFGENLPTWESAADALFAAWIRASRVSPPSGMRSQ
jgi:glycosyltransferase involved in cell wall biosynthesis